MYHNSPTDIYNIPILTIFLFGFSRLKMYKLGFKNTLVQNISPFLSIFGSILAYRFGFV